MAICLLLTTPSPPKPHCTAPRGCSYALYIVAGSGEAERILSESGRRPVNPGTRTADPHPIVRHLVPLNRREQPGALTFSPMCPPVPWIKASGRPAEAWAGLSHPADPDTPDQFRCQPVVSWQAPPAPKMTEGRGFHASNPGLDWYTHLRKHLQLSRRW